MTTVFDLPRMTIDFETRSELDVRKVGAVAYSEHPSTKILCLSYNVRGSGKKPELWTPDRPFPQEIINHVESGLPFEAHNVQFEYNIWLQKLYNLYDISMPEIWMDTMAVCAYRALPLGLDAVGEAVNLNTKKDKLGKSLLQKLSKPRKQTKKDPSKWNEDPLLYLEFYNYCVRDVETEEELSKTIGDLPNSEYKIWQLDQKINQRGVKVDLDAINAAIKIVERIEKPLTKELVAVTNGKVTTGGQTAKMKEWINSLGWEIPNIQKDTVTEYLGFDDLPPDIRRVLEIRKLLSRASTKKLYKFLEVVSGDGRVRGMLQYHGASTGRWAGRLVQPHNLPRPGVTNAIDEHDNDYLDIDLLIQHIKLDLVELMYEDPMEAIASSLRGMFIAGEGKDLLVSDFSSIEACVLAWVAGEVWKLEAFHAGEKIYEKTAKMIFGRPIDKHKDPEERQVGKICELASGYGGSVGAWRNFDKSDRYTDEEIKSYIYQWRDNHPETVKLWYGIEDAAMTAVNTGKATSYKGITFDIVNDKAGKWLTCELPNERLIWYNEPRISWEMMPWGKEKYCLSFMGRDSDKQGRWRLIRTYGGKLVENIVQAISRDLMVEAMFRVEPLGYPVILTVHDEVISEPDEGFGSQEEYDELMSIVPTWAQGCPISVDGWRGKRYRK